jgi:hypothetical protein
MAMINAGLVTMGGKSQYALQNISEGALVGTKQYQEGLEKLEAAALERRKQGAMIEEARRAEARGDWKEGRLLDQQAFEAGLTAERSKIDAVMNIWGVNQKTAVELTTSQNKMASDDARAQMQQREETKRSIYNHYNITSTYGVKGLNVALPFARTDGLQEKNNVMDTWFGQVVCEDHKNVSPVESSRIKSERLKNYVHV